MRHTLALALLASAAFANPALAQSRGGGGEVLIDVWEEQPADQPAAVPAPVTPPIVVPPAPAPPAKPEPAPLRPYNDRALNAVTRPQLTLFTGEREFAGYLRRLEAIKKQRDENWTRNDQSPGIVVAAAFQAQDEPCTDPKLCPPEDTAADVVVSASKTSAPKSITNNQSAGVDEGDIVKQIGDYFLVLQDGRIFAVNIKSMALTDRTDVYRRNAKGDPIGADWYDEMLVQGDNALITAYSYQDNATELSIFRLDQTSGKLSRQGVFLISSDDYYDSDNYATRIVDNKLVLYSHYSLDDLEDRRGRPVIRRWLPPEDRRAAQIKGKPLIDARHIYWPVIRTSEPLLHTITVCPLGDAGARDLACDTTGFVGPERSQMYVSPQAVYLWTATMWEDDYWHQDACAAEGQPIPRAIGADVAPGVVFRLPIDGSEPGVLAVRGGVFDQFSIDEDRGRFRALVNWQSDRCDRPWQAPAEVALVDVPTAQFGDSYNETSGRDFRALPRPGQRNVENRFAGDWLVYGGRNGWGGYPPDAEDGPKTASAIAVPLKHVQDVQVLEPGHQFVRIERVGDDIMMSGYRDDSGLMISLIKLGKTARIGGQTKLAGRYESEGRSHAFNSTVELNGSGLMGIPVVTREKDSGRWWFYSDVSDIAFLGFSNDGTLADLGAIKGTPKDDVQTHDSYECEVSCIDWYGNSRPIFTDNRIFALMATGLVEVGIRGGKVAEKQRIDLTAPLGAK